MNAVYDVVIIGGGAAGLMCAIETAKRGRSTLVIELNESVGKKIRISGGGRCNFTNIETTSKNFISQNPHFCKSALARFTPSDFVALVEKHQIPYHEKKLGQLFCDRSSKDIISMLVQEIEIYGATISLRERVLSISEQSTEPQSNTPCFSIITEHRTIQCQSVVIATGGLSIPSLGANDIGYRIAKQFGHSIIPTRPALVPLTFSQSAFAPFKELSGVSADTLIHTKVSAFRENTLFTHRGISGPAVLQSSSYWDCASPLTINLDPDNRLASVFTEQAQSKAEMATIISHHIAKRLVQTFLDHFNIVSKPMNQYSDRERMTIHHALTHWILQPNGDEGYAKAEVTIGGVNTNELSSKTMESKLQDGLYFIGEVVDVTGWLGGYNFQWAWASGYAAGQVA
jgi:predicted Rossmann fold flavoprotein